MKSLKEQIADRCIHFNGIMNKTCDAGIYYADVRVDRPYKFPCLKQGGECDKCEFLTPEQVDKEIAEINDTSTKALSVYVKIRDDVADKKELSGQIKCECGGIVKYSIASSNQHIRAGCTKCELSIIE